MFKHSNQSPNMGSQKLYTFIDKMIMRCSQCALGYTFLVKKRKTGSLLRMLKIEYI